MPYLTAADGKSRLDSPFRQVAFKREIVVLAGAKWPTLTGSDYIIPLGTPMAPVSATTTGKYKPIRRSKITGFGAPAVDTFTLTHADGFAVGDRVNVLTASPTADLVTIVTVGTISTINYTTGVVVLTAVLAAGCTAPTGGFLEVAENGGQTNPRDAVFLLENVQTRDLVSGTDTDSVAVGVRVGQIEVVRAGNNCIDALTALRQIPSFDYIPTTPGVSWF